MMTTTKQTAHTPGPWTFLKDYDNEGKSSARIGGTIEGDGWNIARIWKDAAELECKYEANARLIAAAPELLAALKDIAKQARLCMQYANAYDGQLIQAIANADAAIAKAEGGQP